MHTSNKSIASSSPRSVRASIPTQIQPLRQLWEDYVQHRNPRCFYLAIDLRDGPSIIWSLNTKEQLGCKDIEYHTLFSWIHPQWRDTIRASTSEAYRCFTDLRTTGTKGQYNYSNNVPMRVRNGEYYWYQQRAFPVAFDARGNSIQVFAEFYKFCPFDNLVPSPASIMIQNRIDGNSSKRVLEAGGKAMAKTLKDLLTGAGYRNLLAYRNSCKEVQEKWTAPSGQEILSQLSMRKPALNKANTRVLGSAKVCFPVSTLSSVADFAVFLNTTFGRPGQ